MIGLSLLVAVVVTIPVLLMPRNLLLWITTPELVEVGLMTLVCLYGFVVDVFDWDDFCLMLLWAWVKPLGP